VKTEPVISLQVNQEKGRLSHMARYLLSAGISVDYVYPSLTSSGETKQLIVKVANVPLASRVLAELSRESKGSVYNGMADCSQSAAPITFF